MKKVSHLYQQFVPKTYNLEIELNKEKLTFKGRVIISGHKTGRPSKRITFHQSGLKVAHAEVIHLNKKEQKQIELDRVNLQNKFEELRLHSKQTIYPGEYQVTLEFSGKITKNMEGIYPCDFKHDGKNKQLIATQFESHFARQLFPCIDEPEAKASFDLTLITDKNEAVVSNTPVKQQEELAKTSQIKTTFETTPVMSTYLLAFVCGEMKYLEAKTKRGVTVRTYATPNNVEYTKFALEVGVKCLDYYSEYFDIDYPLKKCDMIALPDFASGAMENWGCITYREQTLLVDPKNTSVGMKQYVAMVVAHELTHQWFGNLVTMKWWTDLWLNEGFASWFEYLALDHLFPEWEMWTQFIVDDQSQGLKADSLEHTHPVEVEIKHPDEIRSIFDSISYQKGASVIHMLYSYLGAKDFQTGLRYYLKKHAYQNTVTNDLWEAFETASEKPVRSFMHAWTSQTGHPIVKVEVDENNIKIRQARFVLNPKSKHEDHQKWPIPLLINSKENQILESKEDKLPAKSLGNNFVKINKDGAGFYHAVYNASHYQSLKKMILTGKLSPLDRLTLLSDCVESSKSGIIETITALELLESFVNEENSAVWDVIAGLIGSIRLAMGDDALREAMKPYIRELTSKQLARLGWEIPKNESHFDALLRPTVLGLASSADNQSVVDQAIKLFETIKFEKTKSGTKIINDISPDLRPVVYGTVARIGLKKDYDKLLKIHQVTDSNEEKLNACSALTSFQDADLIKNNLVYLKTEHVRLQDVGYWLAYSFANRHAKDLTWKWVKKNWPWLSDNIGSDLSFHRMPLYAARGNSSQDYLEDFKKFFTSVMNPALERSFKQGVEVIEWQTAWMERDYQTIKNYFLNNKFN